MEYQQVPPPTQSTPAQNTAFADALARAREIAAKIGGSAPAGGAAQPDSQSLKRPYEGVGEPQPEAKKMASLNNDPIGAQLKALADQQRAQQAVQAAANAAAQINAKLGIQQNAPNQQAVPNPTPGVTNSIPGMQITENYSVPDRMVGLVIGKGGENIETIQAQTGVKVQFASDSGGEPDRPCTLTGAPQDIQRAKEMIEEYCFRRAKDYIQKSINKGQGLPDKTSMEGVISEEVMISGNKVGLVIGKGGETIKQLQEKAGVKMIMIQDSNQQTASEKPLRITGESSRVNHAKELVFDLLAEKEAMASSFGNEYGNAGKQDVNIPRNLVGVVIGKGGDMIKRITQETGAKLQLKPDDGQAPTRVCMVMGSPESVQEAVEFINSLLDVANTRGGPGQMGGRGGPNRGWRGGDDRRSGGGGGFGGPGKDETTFVVPADKTGLVIGKGGETVREINKVSGAHAELSKDAPPNSRERIFKISGSPDQIQQAIRMICEKAGLPPPQNGRGSGGPGGPQQGFGGFDQSYQQSNGGPPQGAAPQGWGNAYNQWNQPQQSEQRPPQDQNSAAWAQYYNNYYGQNNQQQQQAPQQTPQMHQQPQQPQQQPQQQPPAQSQPTSQAMQPSVNPVTGQPDYSAQWAEYYRQQGLHYHAQAILQQAAQQQQAAAGQAPPQQQQQ